MAVNPVGEGRSPGISVSAKTSESLYPGFEFKNRKHALSTRGIALRNLLTGESPLARFEHGRLYQSACETHVGRAPWISLSPAGRGWRTRGLAMPACTTTTKCW